MDTKFGAFAARAVIAVGAVVVSVGAQAAILSGNFREELSLPNCCGAGTRVLERLGVNLAAGPELTAAHEVANPRGYSGHADVNLSAQGLLTFVGREPDGFANYELAVFKISGLVFDDGASIVGVDVFGQGNEIFDGAFGSAFPTPAIAFTGDSVTITYSHLDQFNFGEELAVQFQLLTGAAAVPEPMSMGLVLAGMFGVAVTRRRSRAPRP